MHIKTQNEYCCVASLHNNRKFWSFSQEDIKVKKKKLLKKLLFGNL